MERLPKEVLDKVLDRVRKLLALAGNNSNPHEAAAAAEKAAQILEEYNLTTVDCDIREIIECPVRFHVMNTPVWYGTLAIHIANAFDCYTFKRVNDDNRNSSAIFVGTKADAEVASYVYIYLFNTCQKLIKKRVQENQEDSDNRVSKKEAREAYTYGLMDMLKERITAFYAKRRERTDNLVTAQGKTGKEIMIIKANAIDAYLGNQKKDYRYSKAETDVYDNMHLYAKGQKDGKNIPLTYAIKSDGTKGAPLLQGRR